MHACVCVRPLTFLRITKSFSRLFLLLISSSYLEQTCTVCLLGFNHIDGLFTHLITKTSVIVGVRVTFRLVLVKTTGPTSGCAQIEELHPEGRCKRYSPLKLHLLLLVFVVLHQALHVLQFPVQLGLLVVDHIHLTSQR